MRVFGWKTRQSFIGKGVMKVTDTNLFPSGKRGSVGRPCLSSGA